MRRRLYDNAERVLGSPVRNLVSILVFVLIVACLATLAYMAAGWSFTDASYMVLLTIYTVGYGEVHRIDTPYLHAVTIGTMVLGCTGMILLTGALVQFFTVLQLRQILGVNRMLGKIDKMSGHVIICGYGRIGQTLAGDLTRAGMPLVIVERGESRRLEAETAGYLTLPGDATEEDVLVTAGVERARALATVLPDDAANVFITLSARNLSANIEIIARGEAATTERKLRRAGADHVIFPTHIGAETIARLILYPKSVGIDGDDRLAQARRELEAVGLELEQVEVMKGAAMAGLSVEAAERRAGGALFVVQIERPDGTRLPRPARDERIEAGDKVLIVMRDASAAARALFTTREQIRAGRNVF